MMHPAEYVAHTLSNFAYRGRCMIEHADIHLFRSLLERSEFERVAYSPALIYFEISRGARWVSVLFLAAVGVAASSLPSYSAGGGGEAPRLRSIAGGPSVEIDAGCLDAYVVLPDRAEELRRRWRCPVNLRDDGSIDHRRGRR